MHDCANDNKNGNQENCDRGGDKKSDRSSSDLKVLALKDLKPTQHAVGYQQVKQKTKKLKKLKKRPKKLKKYLGERPIPVVKGPKEKHYLIDRHHHGSALLRAKQKKAEVEVVADLSSHSKEEFWQEMDEKKFVRTHDENGEKAPFKKIPGSFANLKDDPYRSLAGFVRKAGGYRKVDVPFAEFQWADYFRERISKKEIRKDFRKAFKKALELSQHPEAEDLPGYISREEFQLNAISMLVDQSLLINELSYHGRATCLKCKETYQAIRPKR